MLRELSSTRQIKGEPARKWYFSHDLDLVVWFDALGVPCAFQLAYDKSDDERSVSWHLERGYRHYVVDDGECDAGRSETPFLYTGGAFKKDEVLARFHAAAVDLPSDIAAWVAEKLQGFEGPIV